MFFKLHHVVVICFSLLMQQFKGVIKCVLCSNVTYVSL